MQLLRSEAATTKENGPTDVAAGPKGAPSGAWYTASGSAFLEPVLDFLLYPPNPSGT